MLAGLLRRPLRAELRRPVPRRCHRTGAGGLTAPASAATPGNIARRRELLRHHGPCLRTALVHGRIGRRAFAQPGLYDSLPPQSADEAEATGSTASNLQSTIDEYLQANTSTGQAAALDDFGDKPLVVLTAGSGSDAAWLAAQDDMATLSTNSVHRVIDGATHDIAGLGRARRRRRHWSDPRRRLVDPECRSAGQVIRSPAERSQVMPILLAVNEQTCELEMIQRELVSRYDADYEIVCEQSVESALARLDVLKAAGAQVLVLFAADEMSAMTGIEYLQWAHELHPRAQRVLLIPWGNRSASKPILRAVSLGQIDRFATMPSRSPDENFHHVVTELLRDWQQQEHDDPRRLPW